MNLACLAAGSAARDAGALAIAGPDAALTYGELDAAARALAADLSGRGVARGDRVVIWMDKSAAAVVAMQAVLRLGAVYVPLDGTNPATRTARITRSAAAALILTDAGRAAELADAPPAPVLVASPLAPSAAPVPSAPAEVSDDDLAYILFTSGSTGEPKGVSISHGNALAFIRWAAAEIGAVPADRLANHAPFSFDLSVLDLYVAFLAGASVHLITAELAYAPLQLVAFLRQQEITVWYSVPSVLVLMIRDGGLCDAAPPPRLRAVLFAGEPFAPGYLAPLHAYLRGVRLLNLYGPTETNVCTFHEVTPADVAAGRPVPIGRACSGDQAWAQLDDGSCARPGQEGELLVLGPTVMRGYWGQPPHAGPYRTGDLVRVRADGAFEFIGRRDHMMKVRGHRIEPGEIEKALTEHPQVAEAAVVTAAVGNGEGLVAFLVPAGQPPGLLSIKQHCAKRLPRYMIVDSIVTVTELPRTSNGKTDRRQLATAAAARHQGEESHAR